MNRSLKALGVLLAYPTADLRNALSDIAAALEADPRLPKPALAGVGELIAELSGSDTMDLEERYVALFDRGRLTSLNLFEHVHGESRDRGPAMVDLKQLYQRAGYQLSTRELPDYLPALLEFLSLRPEAEARETLRDCAHILRRIGEALRDRDSRYSAVLAALLAWIGEPGLGASKTAPRTREKSIDEEWIDAEVVFGPGAAPGCATIQASGSSVMQFVPRSR
jgi:nitrate reductase molybdenum cofactor assembly chaperone NarJ/NarW